MEWIEVSLTADGEAAEAVADLLQQVGYQGVAIEQADLPGEAWEDELPPPQNLIVRAYLPLNEETARLQRRLEEGLHHLAQIYPVPQEPTYRRVADEDWAEAWKAHYRPLRVGSHLCIRPAWLESVARPGDIELILDPGMAFGTGTHPSTQLCLIALEALALASREGLAPLPPHVLDLGCGSGILSIAAAKLGAARVWALDIDPLAVKVTQENAARNGVAGVIVAQQGSLENLLGSPRRFGLVLANILAKTIIALCDQGLGHIVQPGGRGIFSGIIEEQTAEVEAALRRCGLIPYKRRAMGEWVAIEAKRPNET